MARTGEIQVLEGLGRGENKRGLREDWRVGNEELGMTEGDDLQMGLERR